METAMKNANLISQIKLELFEVEAVDEVEQD
jgi:hypothetical protein